jgi:hypothetical protein
MAAIAMIDARARELKRCMVRPFEDSKVGDVSVRVRLALLATYDPPRLHNELPVNNPVPPLIDRPLAGGDIL